MIQVKGVAYRQGWNGSGLTTPSSSQRASGLGKAVPTTQSRAGEGQGIGQRTKAQFTCPSQTDCSRPSPTTSFL